MYLTLNFETI